jgi:hypothetical protein
LATALFEPFILIPASFSWHGAFAPCRRAAVFRWVHYVIAGRQRGAAAARSHRQAIFAGSRQIQKKTE